MATSRKVGQGQVVYLGSYLTPELTEALRERLFAPAGVEPLVGGLPEGVEVTMRINDDRRLLFVQNYMDQAVTVGGVRPGGICWMGRRWWPGGWSLRGMGVRLWSWRGGAPRKAIRKNGQRQFESRCLESQGNCASIAINPRIHRPMIKARWIATHSSGYGS